MKSHFFAYISRMRFIQRWALMRNTAPENVQEHSHQVAVLAHALAVIRNEKFGGRLDPGAVAVAALYHDASEIFTGDMPTPIKYDNPAIQERLQGRGRSGGGKSSWECCRRSLRGCTPPSSRSAGPGGAVAGEGGGQALRLYQVFGGAQGRKSGVPSGGGADPSGPGGLWPAGGDLLSSTPSWRASPLTLDELK